MIVHAAESLYWYNTTEPPYLIKGLPISLDSRHTTAGYALIFALNMVILLESYGWT